MPDKYLHIVAFDIPYPPNYGGVIDVWYKLKALHANGINIILHCYEYPGRERSEKLANYCKQVFYYPRLVGINSAISLKPYIVSSRRSNELIKNLLKDSQRGLKFTDETFRIIALKIQNLIAIKGFEAVIEFLKILHILSISKDKKCLASEGFISIKVDEKGDRINKMFTYILTHFNDPNLRITELALESNMSTSAFGHFFKKSTNKSFTQFVVDLRLGYASKLLINSNYSISEIAYKSGFNNIANFNRLFKKNKAFTPKQYRQNLMQSNNFNWEKQLTPNQFIPSDV